VGTIAEARKKGSKAGSWLHGSDLPAKVSSVKVKVADVEEAGEKLNCKAIVKFTEPVYDAEAWTVNATNLDIICEKLKLTGEEDFSELAKRLKGKTLTLTTVMVNDPSKNRAVRSLEVSEIK
jgi:hypothetical protein